MTTAFIEFGGGVVEFDPEKVSLDKIVATVYKAGFPDTEVIALRTASGKPLELPKLKPNCGPEGVFCDQAQSQ